jgi:hypothetical protein
VISASPTPKSTMAATAPDNAYKAMRVGFTVRLLLFLLRTRAL